MESSHAQRKNEHLSLATKLYNQVHTNSFNSMQVIHKSLPEISLNQVNPVTNCGNLRLAFPFFSNSCQFLVDFKCILAATSHCFNKKGERES